MATRVTARRIDRRGVGVRVGRLRIRCLVITAGVAAAVVVALPATALAHSGFVSSTPEPVSTLGTAPGQVVLTFTEPLNARLSRAAVLGPDGSTTTGRVVANDRMVVDLATSETGVYQVATDPRNRAKRSKSHSATR
jgi:methionine-rich copper-binding protein CopC